MPGRQEDTVDNGMRVNHPDNRECAPQYAGIGTPDTMQIRQEASGCNAIDGCEPPIKALLSWWLHVQQVATRKSLDVMTGIRPP